MSIFQVWVEPIADDRRAHHDLLIRTDVRRRVEKRLAIARRQRAYSPILLSAEDKIDVLQPPFHGMLQSSLSRSFAKADAYDNEITPMS